MTDKTALITTARRLLVHAVLHLEISTQAVVPMTKRKTNPEADLQQKKGHLKTDDLKNFSYFRLFGYSAQDIRPLFWTAFPNIRNGQVLRHV